MSHTKHLGYAYWYELYVSTDSYGSDAWRKTLLGIASYVGLLRSWTILVHIENSTVRYFVGANKDVGHLSNQLENAVLRPVDHSVIAVPTDTAAEHMVQFVTGGNILDMREKYQVKRGKDIEWVAFRMHVFSADKMYGDAQFCFKDSGGSYTVANKRIFGLPVHLLSVDFSKNAKYLRKKQPKYLNIQKSLHIMRSDSLGALFEVDTFPYLPQNYYLSLGSYDFYKHSFIIGASGSGKSKLIGLLTQKILSDNMSRQKYRVVVIDPHASLEDDLGGLEGANVVRFTDSTDTAELFAGSGTDISAATELTGTLFKSLLADQHNPKLERVLRFSLYVLMTGQVMSLDTLKRFLVDIEYRKQLLEHVKAYVPTNIIRFFDTDYNELRTQYYNEAISPIVSLVDEMQLQPSLGTPGNDSASIARLISANPLTVFSLNKVSMGEKVVKTVAGLLIQQIFLLAQSRQFNERVILIIDEVSVVQNPALAQILAEARKYNLYVCLSQQYFGQIDKSIQDAIFANVANYYVFRVSEDDARALEGNLTMELPKEALVAGKKTGNTESELRVRMLTALNNRECLLRLSADGQVLPCVRAKTIEFQGKGATKNVKLESYVSTHLPSKFQEAVEAQGAFSEKPDSSGPTSEPVPTATTQEARQSVSMIDFLSGKLPQPTEDLRPDVAVSEQHTPQQSSRTPSLVDFLTAQSSNVKAKQERK